MTRIRGTSCDADNLYQHYLYNFRYATSLVQPNLRSNTMKRAVFKLGTNIVTLDSGQLDLGTLKRLVEQLATAYNDDLEVVIVSSGAVGAGIDTLFSNRVRRVPKQSRHSVTVRQAAAAIGQVDLIAVYKRLFAAHGIDVAQALISRNVLRQRLGYLNIRDTMETLIGAGVIPIVNENDVVAVEELVGIVYGDNDRLSAMLANALDADLLVLLGEMNGLHTADPHLDSQARLIEEVDEITDEIREIAVGPHDERGSGGMRSKLEAADVGMRSGIDVVIADGHVEGVIQRVLAGERIGTVFRAKDAPTQSRKRWILTGRTESRGEMTIDEGAVRALVDNGYSLLPAGVTDVKGDFDRGDIVAVKSSSGDNIAWGISNYSAIDSRTVMGKNSSELPKLLDRFFGTELIHRNNMALS